MRRREFLQLGLGAGVLGAGPLRAAQQPAASGTRGVVVGLVASDRDPIAMAAPVRRALDELERQLIAAGASVQRLAQPDMAPTGARVIIACGRAASPALPIAANAAALVPDSPEALAIVPAEIGDHRALVAVGSDVRGLMYALLDLADRVERSRIPDAVFGTGLRSVERPANVVRSVMRQFTSETLDTPWLHDRAMWPAYIAMLARHRFNRLHLAFGLGYDTLSGVIDSDLVFAYPFLLSVSGYTVRVTNLADADRDRNLETLRFISDTAVAHGLDFQLGLWMHGYQLTNSPRAKYVVEGLTPETHAGYCRDGLTAVLRECPSISAVALRIHGESGIAEGSYEFWRTVFSGVARAGRSVEIDLHAKGLDQTMIGHALDTGMPVNVSPKYWAEHLGMPYHQAAIRELEMPVAGQTGRGLMTISEGQRSFTRYGYADFLRDDRRYTVRHRVFAGTQRLLASGDPIWAAAYGRMFSFCGSTGMDLMEPLTCRGRRGTGETGGSTRIGYTDHQNDPRWDWEKYSYWYRTWGRLTYNPGAPAEVAFREFARDASAGQWVQALAATSRILPIVTTAHLPSAACDAYWPEVYWNQPLVDVPTPNPYGDTPVPKTFAHVSPLDPQLFSGMSEFADELLSGQRTAKYSPIDVATWLEELASVASLVALPGNRPLSPDRARLRADVAIQMGLGQFFAARFRSGVSYAVYERTQDRRALHQAVVLYQEARKTWATLADVASRVYAADLSVSDKVSNRGAWTDRLPAIDQDIGRLLALPESGARVDPRVPAILEEIVGTAERPTLAHTHVPPSSFVAGAPVRLSIEAEDALRPTSGRLWYRHVNQAERFESVSMLRSGNALTAEIPGSYTNAPYPLQYYFELVEGTGRPWLYPYFSGPRANQPYFVVQKATTRG